MVPLQTPVAPLPRRTILESGKPWFPANLIVALPAF
jgi:hypothetical protein